MAVDGALPVVWVEQGFAAAAGEQRQHGSIAGDDDMADVSQHMRHFADVARQHVLHGGDHRIAGEVRQLAGVLGLAGSDEAVEHVGAETCLRIGSASRRDAPAILAIPERDANVRSAEIDSDAVDVFQQVRQARVEGQQVLGCDA